jgi:hypothetical protein
VKGVVTGNACYSGDEQGQGNWFVGTGDHEADCTRFLSPGSRQPAARRRATNAA